jgi:hypothetical protein
VGGEAARGCASHRRNVRPQPQPWAAGSPAQPQAQGGQQTCVGVLPEAAAAAAASALWSSFCFLAGLPLALPLAAWGAGAVAPAGALPWSVILVSMSWICSVRKRVYLEGVAEGGGLLRAGMLGAGRAPAAAAGPALARRSPARQRGSACACGRARAAAAALSAEEAAQGAAEAGSWRRRRAHVCLGQQRLQLGELVGLQRGGGQRAGLGCGCGGGAGGGQALAWGQASPGGGRLRLGSGGAAGGCCPGRAGPRQGRACARPTEGVGAGGLAGGARRGGAERGRAGAPPGARAVAGARTCAASASSCSRCRRSFSSSSTTSSGAQNCSASLSCACCSGLG